MVFVIESDPITCQIWHCTLPLLRLIIHPVEYSTVILVRVLIPPIRQVGRYMLRAAGTVWTLMPGVLRREGNMPKYWLITKGTVHWGTFWCRSVPTAIVLCLGVGLFWALQFYPASANIRSLWYPCAHSVITSFDVCWGSLLNQVSPTTPRAEADLQNTHSVHRQFGTVLP
jgi:hypothetical protein